MNPKIDKMKVERNKNTAKIAELSARNKELDAKILELENLDIIGMVRERSMSPEELSAMLKNIYSVTVKEDGDDE